MKKFNIKVKDLESISDIVQKPIETAKYEGKEYLLVRASYKEELKKDIQKIYGTLELDEKCNDFIEGQKQQKLYLLYDDKQEYFLLYDTNMQLEHKLNSCMASYNPTTKDITYKSKEEVGKIIQKKEAIDHLIVLLKKKILYNQIDIQHRKEKELIDEIKVVDYWKLCRNGFPLF